MANKTESTAVNALIELVASGRSPSNAAADDDLFKVPAPYAPPAPLPRSRTPVGTQRNVPTVTPAISTGQVRVITAPPPRAESIPPLNRKQNREREEARVTARSAAIPRSSLPPPTRGPAVRPSGAPTGTFQYPTPVPSATNTTLPFSAPTAAPFEPAARRARHSDVEMGVDTAIEEAVGSDRVLPAREGTQQITRRQPFRQFARTLVVPMLILFGIGAAIGGYFAMEQRKAHRRTVAAAAAAAKADKQETQRALATESSAGREPTMPTIPSPGIMPPDAPVVMIDESAPAAPPPSSTVAAPAQPGTEAGALVEIRIDSDPAGATVTLVDRGQQTFLGTTPLNASVDGSRSYELVLTAPNLPTKIVALDPKASTRVAVALVATAPASAPAPAVVKAPAAAVVKPPVAAKPTPAPAKPRRVPPTPAAPAATPSAAAANATGILMISTKPPCEIAIDGKATGLTTPQRAITLSAGRHKVTLTNITAGIRKHMSVTITAGTSTKVIQDLMPR